MLNRADFPQRKHTSRKGINFGMYQKLKRTRKSTEKSQTRKTTKIKYTNKKDIRSKSNKITRKPINRMRFDEARGNVTQTPNIGRKSSIKPSENSKRRTVLSRAAKNSFFESRNANFLMQNSTQSRVNVAMRRRERRRRLNLRLGSSLKVKRSPKMAERTPSKNSSFSIRVEKYNNSKKKGNNYLNVKKYDEMNLHKFEEVTPQTRASSNFDTPKIVDSELDFDQLNSKSNFFSIKKKRTRKKTKKKTFNELANEVKKLRDQRLRTEIELGEKEQRSIFDSKGSKKFKSLFEMRKRKKEGTQLERVEKKIGYFKDLFKDFDPIRPIGKKHIKLKDYLSECLTVIDYFKSERILPPVEQKIERKARNLKKRKEDKNKKITLVFDLDETLIHCVENRTKGFDVALDIFNSFLARNIKTHFNLRPHLTECLEALSKRFELMIFTASQPHYANKIIDHIDPKGKYFSHRLFRNDCIELQPNLFTKDLRIIKNRNPSKIILIDNALYSYYFTPKQAVPILPFTDNKNDEELSKLTEFFLDLFDEADVPNYCSEVLKQREVKNCKNLRDFVKLYSSLN